MFAKRVLLAVVSAVVLVSAPLSARAADTRYDRCMDAAEEQFVKCLDKSSSWRSESLCWSRFGYQKLWCTIRYVGDIV